MTLEMVQALLLYVKYCDFVLLRFHVNPAVLISHELRLSRLCFREFVHVGGPWHRIECIVLS